MVTHGEGCVFTGVLATPGAPIPPLNSIRIPLSLPFPLSPSLPFLFPYPILPLPLPLPFPSPLEVGLLKSS